MVWSDTKKSTVTTETRRLFTFNQRMPRGETEQKEKQWRHGESKHGANESKFTEKKKMNEQIQNQPRSQVVERHVGQKIWRKSAENLTY